MPPGVSRADDGAWGDCEPLARPVARSMPHASSGARGGSICASPFAAGPARAAAPESVQVCSRG